MSSSTCTAAASCPRRAAAGPGPGLAQAHHFGRRLREVDVDRVDLLHHGQRRGFALAHQGAFRHQRTPDAAADGRADAGVAQADAGRLHGGLGGGDPAFDCWKAACALNASCWLTAWVLTSWAAPRPAPGSAGLASAWFARPGQRRAAPVRERRRSRIEAGRPSHRCPRRRGACPGCRRRVRALGPRGRPPGAPAARPPAPALPACTVTTPTSGSGGGPGAAAGFRRHRRRHPAAGLGRRGTGPGGGQNAAKRHRGAARQRHGSFRGRVVGTAAGRCRQRHLACPVKQCEAGAIAWSRLVTLRDGSAADQGLARPAPQRAVQQHQAGQGGQRQRQAAGSGTRWLRRTLSRLPPKVSLRPTALKLSTLAPLCATTLKRCSLQ